jgi:hypothetical protein
MKVRSQPRVSATFPRRKNPLYSFNYQIITKYNFTFEIDLHGYFTNEIISVN